VRRGPKPRKFECPEPVFWYLVGLITSDGCLSQDGRRITIAAKDRNFLEQVRASAGITSNVGAKGSGAGNIHYQLQIGSTLLQERLRRIGLTPRKSLTLGPLAIPDEWFGDFMRGVIDGDGNIHRWIHPTNRREQWVVRIYSCAEPFIEWVQESLSRLWGVSGGLYTDIPKNPKHHPKYTLKFGKLAARVLLSKCYLPGAIALERKATLALACQLIAVGWRKSPTVQDQTHWKNWQYSHTYKRMFQPGKLTENPVDPTAGMIRDCSADYFYAGVLELVDNTDLKSVAPEGACGFESHPRHIFYRSSEN
jgi:LAGLIDADG-like domain